MKYCGQCRVTVRGSDTTCPLCQSRLSGAVEPLGPDDEAVYPMVPTVFRQFELFFKLLILSSIAICVGSAAVNLVLPKDGYWSLFIVLGTVCFWIVLAYAIRKKDNILKNITFQVVIVSVLSVGWDWFTGWNGWSLNFVFPSACIVAMLSLAVISRVMKMPSGDYIVYLIVDIAFGIVPLVFYLTGLINTVIPSAFCIFLSILSLSALVLFEGDNMRREMIRVFHL